MYTNTLIGEITLLEREEFHEAKCNIIIYVYIYNIFIYISYSELKHLINYKNRNSIDIVSSGERT